MTAASSPEDSGTTPSYHGLYVTTSTIPRTSIFDLPYGYEVSCTRVSGWQLWSKPSAGSEMLVAGEYDSTGLTLDLNGMVIVSSPDRPDEDEDVPW